MLNIGLLCCSGSMFFWHFRTMQAHLHSFSSLPVVSISHRCKALLALQTSTFAFSVTDVGPLEVGQAWLASEFGEAGFKLKVGRSIWSAWFMSLWMCLLDGLFTHVILFRCVLHSDGCRVVRCFLFEPQDAASFDLVGRGGG